MLLMEFVTFHYRYMLRNYRMHEGIERKDLKFVFESLEEMRVRRLLVCYWVNDLERYLTLCLWGLYGF